MQLLLFLAFGIRVAGDELVSVESASCIKVVQVNPEDIS
jgi:hypothetical protein